MPSHAAVSNLATAPGLWHGRSHDTAEDWPDSKA